MKYLLFCAFLATLDATTASWSAPSANQYHIQTDEGPERYFRYQTDSGQYRKEKRLADGTVIGTDGWIDASGYLRLRNYIADNQGYRILKSKTVFVGKNRPIQEAIKSTNGVSPQAGVLVGNPAIKSSVPAKNYIPVEYTTPAPVAYLPPRTQTYLPPRAETYTTPAPVAYTTPAPVAYITPRPISYIPPQPVSYTTPAPVTYITSPRAEYNTQRPQPIAYFSTPLTPIVEVSPNSLPISERPHLANDYSRPSVDYQLPYSSPTPLSLDLSAPYESSTSRPFESSTFNPNFTPIIAPISSTTARPQVTSTPTPITPLISNSVDVPVDHYQKAQQYDPYKNNPYYAIHRNGQTDSSGYRSSASYQVPQRQAANQIGNGYDPQYQQYDGVAVTGNGFRYYLPRQYHEEENSGSDTRSGSFGYVDPFGIRRVVYYNTAPGTGFQHKKNNRYVGLDATPYDPRPL